MLHVLLVRPAGRLPKGKQGWSMRIAHLLLKLNTMTGCQSMLLMYWTTRTMSAAEVLSSLASPPPPRPPRPPLPPLPRPLSPLPRPSAQHIISFDSVSWHPPSQTGKKIVVQLRALCWFSDGGFISRIALGQAACPCCWHNHCSSHIFTGQVANDAAPAPPSPPPVPRPSSLCSPQIQPRVQEAGIHHSIKEKPWSSC